MSRLIYFFVALCIFAQSAPFALAQESIIVPTPPSQTGELLECSDFFSPNKVRATFTANPPQTAPNEIVTFTGTIQNEHSYPLVDASLHVKIFKRNEATRIQGYGDIVVEQQAIESGLVIPAVGSRAVKFEWKAPANIEGGEYYAVFYVTAAGTDFPVMGVNAGDDNLFNQIDFKVIHDGFIPTVYFDRATLEVNNEPYLIETKPVVSSEEATVISTTVVNPTSETKIIPVQWSETTFRTALEQPLQSSKTELLTLEPGEVRDISFNVPPKKDGVTYVTAILDDNTAKQYLNVTFLRTGTEVFAPQLTVASPLTFPFFAGKETLLFSCIDSLIETPSTDNYSIRLILRDADDQIIHQYKSTGPLSTLVQGFGGSFVPVKDYKYAKLTATVQYEGRLILATEVEYDCAKEGFGECEEKEIIITPTEEKHSFSTGLAWPLILIGVLILVIVAVVLVIKKKNSNQQIPPPSSTTIASILFLLALGVLSVFPSVADAQWCDPCFDNGVLDPTGMSCGFNGDQIFVGMCTEGCGDACGAFDVSDGLICFTGTPPVNNCPLPPPPPPPTPPPTGSISGSGCMIAIGASTCDGLVAWTSANATMPTVRNVTRDALISSSANGTNVAATLTQGSNYIILRNDTVIVESTSLTAVCAMNSIWDGSSCVASGCQPDGYTQSFIAPNCCSGLYSTVSANSCTVYNNSQMPYGGTICLNFDEYTCTPAPTPSGTISGSGCTISAGNSSCNGSVTWSTTNTPSPNVRNTTTNVQYSTAVSGNMSASLQYGSNSVVVRNSSTVLASTDLTASCVGGTSWNGSTCALPPPSGTVSGAGCTISAGNSSCSGTVTWSTSNTPSPNIINTTTNVQYSTAASGNNAAAALVYGSNSISVRNSSTILGTTVLSANCVGGTTWNGSSCALPPPAPSGTVSGATCVISAGNSTCSGTVTWSINNTPSPNIINTTTNNQYSTNPSGTNVAAVLAYGSNSISVRNSSTVLDTTILTTSCVGGTSWNGSSCALPPPVVPSGTVSGAGCTISAGNSTCSGTVTWSTSNATSPNIRNTTTNVQYSSSPSGSNVPATLVYGSNSVSVRDSSTVLGTTALTASCAGGTSWNGSSCVVLTPTGTVSGSGCMISAGNSSCNGSVTWSTTNTPSPNVRNTTTNVQYSTNPSGTNVAAALAYGANSVSVRNSSTVLGTTVLSANCVGGTTWNGSSCAVTPPTTVFTASPTIVNAGQQVTFSWDCPSALIGFPMAWFELGSLDTGGLRYERTGGGLDSYVHTFTIPGSYTVSGECISGNPALTPPAGVTETQMAGDVVIIVNTPPPPSGTISGTTCTIVAGANACNAVLTWNINNAVSPNVTNINTGTVYSNAVSGNNVNAAITYGSNTVRIRDGVSVLGTVTLTASCASGSSWNGSSCQTLTIPPQNDPGTCFTDSIVDATGTTCGVNGDYVPFLNACSYGCGSGCGQFDDMDTGICFLPVIPPSCSTVGYVATTIGQFNSYSTDCINAGYSVLEIDNNVEYSDLGLISNTNKCLVTRDNGSGWAVRLYANSYCTGSTPTAFVSGTGCTIAAGASTCNGALTWDIEYASSPNVRNTTSGATYSTNPSGSGVSVTLGQGVNTIAARDTNVALATTNLTAACAVGSTWNGSVCLLNVIPDIDLKINAGDGPLNVAAGTALNLSWTGVGVSNCRVYGPGFAFTGQAVSVPGNQNVAASVSDNYIINCTGDWDTVVVNILPLPTVSFTARVNNTGAWTTADRTINPGDTLAISWDSSTDATSCTNSFGAPNTLDNTGVTVTPPSPGGLPVTYTVTCSGPGGNVSEDIVVTTNGLPNLTTAVSFDTSASTIDPATGYFNSTEVRIQINNVGQSVAGASAYRLLIDYGNAPPDFDQTTALASIPASGNINISRIINNVPFGPIAITVTADPNNVVAEANDGDNVGTYTGNLAAQKPPGFDITATPLVVREGQTADITWDTEVTYDLDCSISGPALTTYSFNPSNPLQGPTGSRPTGILSSKSEYLLSCTEPTTNTTFTETASVDIVPNAQEI